MFELNERLETLNIKKIKILLVQQMLYIILPNFLETLA